MISFLKNAAGLQLILSEKNYPTKNPFLKIPRNVCDGICFIAVTRRRFAEDGFHYEHCIVQAFPRILRK